VPTRGIEITLIGDYPRPTAWGKLGSAKGDGAEIPLMQSGAWHPTTEDFLAVAAVPNEGTTLKTRRTEVFTIHSVGEMLGAISSPTGPLRPLRSVGRVNLITHGMAPVGKEPLIGLAGRIDANGDCFLGLSVAETPSDVNAPSSGKGLDMSVVSWLNGSGKSLRDQVRAVLRPDAVLALICCNSGGDRAALNLMGSRLATELGRTFDVAVGTYDSEVQYLSTFRDGKILTRDITKVASRSESGPGYFCHVAVPARLAGAHLKFTNTPTRPSNPFP
jgi:hypothetical protein